MWIQAIGKFCLALSILIFYQISVILYVDGISRRTNTVDKIHFFLKFIFYLYWRVKVVIFMIWDLILKCKKKHELLYIHISMNRDNIINYVRGIWKYMTVRLQILKKISDTLHTQCPSCQFAWRLNSFLIAVKLCQLNCDFMQILSCNDMQWIIY